MATEAARMQQRLFEPSVSELPKYEGPGRLRNKYVSVAKRALGGLKAYMQRMGESHTFRNVRATFKKMPTAYQAFVAGTKLHLYPVGQVFGQYHPDTDELSAEEELADGSKQHMDLYKHEIDLGTGEVKSKHAGRIRKPPLLRVFGEELFHAAQERMGAIRAYVSRYGPRRAHAFIEGAATVVSNELYGRMGTYPREEMAFRKLADRIGMANAVTGRNLPQAA